MTEQEKVISRLCLEMQYYFEELCNAYCIEESYCMDRIGNCIEQIHRLVNPDFTEDEGYQFCSRKCAIEFHDAKKIEEQENDE